LEVIARIIGQIETVSETYCFVMQVWTIACEVVSSIALPFLLCHSRQASKNVTLYTSEAHVDGLGLALSDSAVQDASDGGVVGGDDNGDGVLQVARIGEGGEVETGFDGIVEKYTQFCFSG
jgi:hypothetical protein